MPFTLVLTLKSGRVTSSLQVFNRLTPKRGAVIELEHEGRVIKARVIAAGRSRPMEPGSQAVDIVNAQEIQSRAGVGNAIGPQKKSPAAGKGKRG